MDDSKAEIKILDMIIDIISYYWVFCIAAAIMIINITCRITDSQAVSDYIKTEGVVTGIRSETATLNTGGYYGRQYHFYEKGDVYHAKISFKYIDGSQTESFDVRFENRVFHKDDTVPVMYNTEYSKKPYLAKRDWITGAWLNAGKDYNTPLIIALMLILFGIYYLFLTGLLKARFKYSGIVLSLSGILIGISLSTFCIKVYQAGGEMADEALTGFFAGILLTFFSAVYFLKKHKIRRDDEQQL